MSVEILYLSKMPDNRIEIFFMFFDFSYINWKYEDVRINQTGFLTDFFTWQEKVYKIYHRRVGTYG